VSSNEIKSRSGRHLKSIIVFKWDHIQSGKHYQQVEEKFAFGRKLRIILLLVVETEIIDNYFLIDKATYETYWEYYYGRKYNNRYPTRQVDENKYYLSSRRQVQLLLPMRNEQNYVQYQGILYDKTRWNRKRLYHTSFVIQQLWSTSFGAHGCAHSLQLRLP